MLGESILGRAQARGLLDIRCHQIRDYTENRQKQVDDYPYGGGWGQVMMAQPLKKLPRRRARGQHRAQSAPPRHLPLPAGGRRSRRRRPASSRPTMTSSCSSAATMRAWMSASSRRAWTRSCPSATLCSRAASSAPWSSRTASAAWCRGCSRTPSATPARAIGPAGSSTRSTPAPRRGRAAPCRRCCAAATTRN